jgi:hypothetical protein
MSPNSGPKRLRELLKQPGIIRSLGAHDVFTAPIVEQASGMSGRPMLAEARRGKRQSPECRRATEARRTLQCCNLHGYPAGHPVLRKNSSVTHIAMF